MSHCQQDLYPLRPLRMRRPNQMQGRRRQPARRQKNAAYPVPAPAVTMQQASPVTRPPVRMKEKSSREKRGIVWKKRGIVPKKRRAPRGATVSRRQNRPERPWRTVHILYVSFRSCSFRSGLNTSGCGPAGEGKSSGDGVKKRRLSQRRRLSPAGRIHSI